ncbi:MAG: hypothetical protein U0946_02295 [Patescibacteria group bacterium]|nr:hypothetical protein [Patescibacteria group bacterium]
MSEGIEGVKEWLVKTVGPVKEKYEQLNPPLSKAEKTKQRKKRKKALAWIGATGVGVGGIIIAKRIGMKEVERVQAEATPTTESPLGGGNTLEDNSANYHYITIGRVGFQNSGYSLDINNPQTFISKEFVEMGAKFGGDFLLPPGYNDHGEITGQVSEAVVNDWAKVLNVDPTEIRQNYVYWQTYPEEFRQFLLKHGVSQTVVDFLAKLEELETEDADKASWFGGPGNPPDRYEKLQEWLKEKGIIIGKIETGNKLSWDWVESTSNIAEKIGVNPQDVLGLTATLRAEGQYGGSVDWQLKAVEGAAQAIPDILQSGFVATNADWATSYILVGLMAVGAGIRPAAILKDWVAMQGQELRDKLAIVGKEIIDNLREKSPEFRGWTEEERQQRNSRQLVNRLRNGLSLSREFVFDLGGILNNPQNQDLRDLVLIEGPNWFRHMPETHPEIGQILRFFGCRNYSELQVLAKQPTLIVPKLEELLTLKIKEYRERGKGKDRGIRLSVHKILPEDAEGLIVLYKKASGFNQGKNQ